MPKLRHGTHRYIRRALGANQVWACAVPNCTHYVPRYMEATLINDRPSLCNQCGNEFLLTEDSRREDMPRCDSCRLGLKKVNDDDLNQALADLLGEPK